MDELVTRVANALILRKQTVAFAESCTGGLVSARLATYAGVSAAFLGSVVAYSNAVKTRLLDVPGTVLATAGAVSAPCASAMAKGALARIGADWAVSVTGIAGPGGGTSAKPVGTVFFGILGPGVESTESALFAGSRIEIQRAACEHALALLLRYLVETNRPD